MIYEKSCSYGIDWTESILLRIGKYASKILKVKLRHIKTKVKLFLATSFKNTDFLAKYFISLI